MTTIPSTTGVGTTSQQAAAAGANSNPLNQLTNTQTFLQLLVAQLKNQNPTSPTDPTAFMTEISQLAGVESQTNLASQEQVVAADSMLGKVVTGQGSKGQVAGVVTGVLLSSSGAPELQVGTSGTTLPITAITKVTDVTTAATTGSTSGSSAGSAGTSTGSGGTSGTAGTSTGTSGSSSGTSTGTPSG